ncbi:MAG TPA: hypothetical protein PLV81_13805, partial [Spirochaetota bacterium]|nr:hypothetical protein [Spirochaetota bacterium]
IRQQAQLSLFDRVLAFFSLSQPLQADPVLGNLPYPVNLITVNVSAHDMVTITREIPLETGQITLEVPAGSQRTFEVVAGELAVGAPVFSRYYGGITTLDLSPGQQVNLNIEMGKLVIVNEWDRSFDQNNSLFIYINCNSPSSIIGFNIYLKINEQLILQDTVTEFDNPSSGYYQFYYPSFNEEYVNNYYLSGINKYGEGNSVQRPQ